jgi:hypothetical protein
MAHPRLPAVQDRAAPGAGSSAKRSASGATTLSSMRGRPFGLCEPPRDNAGPDHYTINSIDAITPRRDAFVGLPAFGGLARLRWTCPPPVDLPASGGLARLRRGRPPCRSPLDRGWKPLPQENSASAWSRSRRASPSRASSSEIRTVKSAVAAGGSCVMRVRRRPPLAPQGRAG